MAHNPPPTLPLWLYLIVTIFIAAVTAFLVAAADEIVPQVLEKKPIEFVEVENEIVYVESPNPIGRASTFTVTRECTKEEKIEVYSIASEVTVSILVRKPIETKHIDKPFKFFVEAPGVIADWEILEGPDGLSLICSDTKRNEISLENVFWNVEDLAKIRFFVVNCEVDERGLPPIKVDGRVHSIKQEYIDIDYRVRVRPPPKVKLLSFLVPKNTASITIIAIILALTIVILVLVVLLVVSWRGEGQ